MGTVPSYGKIFTLGSAGTAQALTGPVVIQEKVDGSQFSFGIDAEGNYVFKSKNQPLHIEAPAKMFEEAVTSAHRALEKLQRKESKREIYFYGEYLQKPKHNALTYDRVPKGHIVLFEGVYELRHMGREYLQYFADMFELDIIPQLHEGEINLHELGPLYKDVKSFLGGVNMEGIVIKNYGQHIVYNNNLYPLFTKVVCPAFKERNSEAQKEFKKGWDLNEFILSFKSEARWVKALQRIKENGEYTGEPKDIANLIKEVQKDLADEEKETIKHALYRAYIKDITRVAVSGLPEWYKNLLITQTFGGVDDTNNKEETATFLVRSSEELREQPATLSN